MIREQVEAVLRKHGLGIAFRYPNEQPFDNMTSTLFDDLLALSCEHQSKVRECEETPRSACETIQLLICSHHLHELRSSHPTPSREALVAELDRFVYKPDGENMMLLAERDGKVFERLVDRLMAWATGRETRREWCAHRRWIEDDTLGWCERNQVTKRWDQPVWIGANFCEECAAPRPPEDGR